MQVEGEFRNELMQRCRYEHRLELQHNNAVTFRDRSKKGQFVERPKPNCDRLNEMFGSTGSLF